MEKDVLCCVCSHFLLLVVLCNSCLLQISQAFGNPSLRKASSELLVAKDNLTHVQQFMCNGIVNLQGGLRQVLSHSVHDSVLRLDQPDLPIQVTSSNSPWP